MTYSIQKPSILQRFRAAVKFYQDGYRAFYRPITNQHQATKKAPYMVPLWRDNVPMWQLIDYQSYAVEGFSRNAILFAAIMYKARACSTAPLRAYKGNEDRPELLPPDNDLQRLCMRPNRWQSQAEFQSLAEVYLNLAGNVYIAIDRKRGQDTPRGLYMLRPDRVYIVPKKNKKDLLGFLYVPEGSTLENAEPWLPEDIIHIKYPNPYDPLEGLGYGLSPVASMAQSVDVDNSVTKYMNLFFQNGAMPPGVLKFKHVMNNDAVSAARERWMEIYGGVENWTEVAVLDQAGEYEQLGLSFKDMDMAVIDSRSEARIVGPLGVPLTLITSRPQLVQATYNNKETDRRMFWEDTMVPELRWFEVDYQYYITGAPGEFVKFGLSKVPALAMSRNEMAEIASMAFQAGGINRLEFRGLLPFDLDLDTGPDNEGNQGTSEPTGSLPEATEQAREAEADDGKSKKSADGASESTGFDAIEFARKVDELAVSFEPEFEDATVQAFQNDRTAVLAIINKGKKTAIQDKATIDFSKIIAAINLYYSASGKAASNWENELDAAIDAIVEAKVLQLNDEFGFDTPPGAVLSQDWLENYKLEFSTPINETSSDELTAILKQAQEEGWSHGQMVKRVGLTFDQWQTGDVDPELFDWVAERRPFWRTELIVRTETMRASNASAYATYGLWGTETIEWIATGDDRTRPSHKSANGQKVKLGEKFDVGGSALRFPGDPQGSLNETANCRCTIAPVL